MASRLLSDLQPAMKDKTLAFLEEAKSAGLDVLIYCTFRSLEEQAILYRQSRSLSEIKAKAKQLTTTFNRLDIMDILLGVGPQHGPHVTNAAPGQSLHNYGYAFDGVPMVGGKPMWNSSHPSWQTYGQCARSVGLEWAGDWTSFREYPHCQLPGMDWRVLIQGR